MHFAEEILIPRLYYLSGQNLRDQHEVGMMFFKNLHILQEVCESFATITALFYEDNEPKRAFFAWKRVHKAFRALKSALCTSLILAYLSQNRKFILGMDACKVGIKAVLSQLQDHEVRV